MDIVWTPDWLLRNLAYYSPDWLNALNQDCIRGLSEISHTLYQKYIVTSKVKDVYPNLLDVMLPFHLVKPTSCRCLLLTLRPYLTDYAGRLPISLKGDTEPTSTLEAMRSVYSEVFKEDLDYEEVIPAFYKRGILIFNASATECRVYDPRYKFTFTHSNLWSKFIHPFCSLLTKAYGIPVILAGEENWVYKAACEKNFVKCVLFPKPGETSELSNTLKILFPPDKEDVYSQPLQS